MIKHILFDLVRKEMAWLLNKDEKLLHDKLDNLTVKTIKIFGLGKLHATLRKMKHFNSIIFNHSIKPLFLNKFRIMSGIVFSSICLVCYAKDEISKNLISGDSSFETGINELATASFYTHNVNMNIENNDSAVGEKSLRLKFTSRDWTLGKPVQLIPGKTYTFSIYAKAQKNNTRCQILIVNMWQDVKEYPIILSDTWKRYSFTIKTKQKDYYLGLSVKEKCKEPFFPWRIDFKNPIIIWVDGWQLEEGDKTTPYKNREPISILTEINPEYNNVFLEGEGKSIKIGVHKQWKKYDATNHVLSYVITDYNDRTVINQKFNIVLDEKGRYEKSIYLDPRKLGFFSIVSKVTDQFGKQVTEAIATFARVKKPVQIKDGLIPFCGIDHHKIPCSPRIGDRWLQVNVSWNNIENPQNNFIWDSSDIAFLRKKEGYFIKLFLRDEVPEWASKRDPKNTYKGGLCAFPQNMEDYRKFVSAVVNRYKNVVDIWEIGGESEYWWGVNPWYREKYPDAVEGCYTLGPVTDKYAEMVRTAVSEIRSVIPNAQIGAIRPSDCTSFIFPIDVFKKVGKEFNLFPLDPYWPKRPWYITLNEKNTPKMDVWLAEAYKRANHITKEYGIGQSIYVSELGCGLLPGLLPYSNYAFEQACQLAKSFLISRATEGYGSLFMWYCTGPYLWGMKKEIENYKEIDWGTLSFGMMCTGINSPMPAIPAFSAVAQLVENVDKSRMLDLEKKAKAVIFKKNTGACAAIWTNGFENRDISLTIPNKDDLKITDYMGNELLRKKQNKETTIQLGRYPVYFHLTGKKAYSQLSTIISKISFVENRDWITVNKFQVINGKIVIDILSKVEKNLNIELNLNISLADIFNKKINLLPGETKTVEFKLPPNLSCNSKSVQIEIKAIGYKALKFNFDTNLTRCEMNRGNIIIDGNLSDWEKMNPLSIMNTGAFLSKYEIEAHNTWTGPDDLSAVCYIAWDKDNFYFAAEVTDNKHINNMGNNNIWNGDSIQIAFVPNPIFYCNDKNETVYGINDSKIGFALTTRGLLTHQYVNSKDMNTESVFAIKRNEKQNKTVYEVKIPFKALNIIPKEGYILGFGFALSDDDDGGGQRYWMQLTPGIVDRGNTSLLRKIILTK